MVEYPHFSKSELECKHCGECEMDDDFMWKLVALRKRIGTPFHVTSAYRCPKYDESFGGKGNHSKGKAIDFQISGPKAWQAVDLAPAYGFTGVGARQHGDHPQRYLHLDTTHEQFTFWTYQ